MCRVGVVSEPAGLDATSAPSFEMLSGHDPVHLALDGPRFVDTVGARALLDVAAARPGRSLVLHEPSPLLRRLLEITVQAEQPSLRVEPAESWLRDRAATPEMP